MGGASVADATAAEVITSMQNQPAWFSREIFQSLALENPFLTHVSRTKVFFNEGMGDTDTTLIFDVSAPNEKDVLNWQEVKEASPNYNPSRWTTTKEITYGHRKVSATLFRDAVRTPHFSKIDLTFKPRREKQLQQVRQIMLNWTRGIWSLWSTMAFVRSVNCRVLNTTWGDQAEQVGAYPTFTRPDTLLTFRLLETIAPSVIFTSRGFNSAAAAAAAMLPQDQQVVFIGYNEYQALIEQYMKELVTSFGNRPDETFIPELKLKATPLGKYMFVIVPYPRKYREPASNESWEDAIIESHIKVPADGGAAQGYVMKENPDYFNPGIAKYTESLWVNLDSVEWLVPPAAMTNAMSDGKTEMFPATDYAGEFKPFHSPEDPYQETVCYYARYMSGMKGLFPKRSRAILHLAAHPTATPYRLTGQQPSVAAGTRWNVQNVATNSSGNLEFLIAGTLPGSLPAGYTLYAVTRSGKRYIVASIVSNTAFAGNAKYAAGRKIELTLPTAVNNESPSDPWASLDALPNVVPSDITDSTTVKTFAAYVVTDTVTGMVGADGTTNLLGGSSYTSASALQTAIQTYLDANDGGTASVTGGTALTGYLWTIKITGAAGDGLAELSDADAGIKFQDGIGTNKVPFESENL